MEKLLEGDALLGTGNALQMALSGFSGSAVALVAAALFLATAMQVTNLHKRLALQVLSIVGNKTNRIVIGAIVVSIILAFFCTFSYCKSWCCCTHLIRNDCCI